jgi:hypothetical protein
VGHLARLALAVGIAAAGILGGLWIASEAPDQGTSRVFVWVGAALGVLLGCALVLILSNKGLSERSSRGAIITTLGAVGLAGVLRNVLPPHVGGALVAFLRVESPVSAWSARA